MQRYVKLLEKYICTAIFANVCVCVCAFRKMQTINSELQSVSSVDSQLTVFHGRKRRLQFSVEGGGVRSERGRKGGFRGS